MSVLTSARERLRRVVPGLTTKTEQQRQAMVDLAEMQGVPVGQFRCEDCGTQKSVADLGGWALTKTSAGEVRTIARCKICSVKFDDDDD